MPSIVLFAIILAAGIILLPLSRPAKTLPKIVLRILSIVMIALSAFGIVTTFL